MTTRSVGRWWGTALLGPVATIVSKAMPVAPWYALLENPETTSDLYLIGAYPSYPDPDAVLYQQYHSTSARKGSFNFGQYKNPVADKLLTATGVYGFWPAVSEDDDVVVYRDREHTGELAWFNLLRQQEVIADGKANLSLADFIAPRESGVGDYIGAFAVTAGIGASEFAASFERDHDDYNSIIVKALADRLAEAFAAEGRATEPAARRGVVWLLRAQEPDGSWFGRWGANYLYGTGAVVPALIAALSASPSSATAAGAALVLGAMKAKEGAPAIVRGMQRGIVPLRHGLRGLAGAGSPASLPTVLELIDDDDPSVRREAVRAAIALLDPARADGRAVDPVSEALASGERIEIRGFGSFSLHYRPPRMGRNPKTGEAVALAGKNVPHFKPGKDLRERVNESRHLPVRD